MQLGRVLVKSVIQIATAAAANLRRKWPPDGQCASDLSKQLQPPMEELTGWLQKLLLSPDGTQTIGSGCSTKIHPWTALSKSIKLWWGVCWGSWARSSLRFRNLSCPFPQIPIRIPFPSCLKETSSIECEEFTVQPPYLRSQETLTQSAITVSCRSSAEGSQSHSTSWDTARMLDSTGAFFPTWSGKLALYHLGLSYQAQRPAYCFWFSRFPREIIRDTEIRNKFPWDCVVQSVQILCWLQQILTPGMFVLLLVQLFWKWKPACYHF